MKFKLLLQAIALVVFLPVLSFANEAADLPNAFMQKIMAGKGAEATDQYFGTNPLIGSKQQQIEFVKTQIDSAFKIFGQPLGYELAIEEQISKSLKRFVFITKHQYHVLSWEFYIYKPRDKWIGSNMTFNDKYNLLETKK